MGWWPFSSSPSGPNNLPRSSDGGRIAPDRSSREQCYEARDVFFACLDRHDILDATKHDREARRNCAKEIAEFEAACSRTWVKYFKEKRVMEYNRDKTIERIKREDEARAAEQKAQRALR